MNLPYSLRLLCLCLACFSLVHLAFGMIVVAAAPAAIRMAKRLRANAGALLLLTLRLAPVGFALLVVAGLCVPSYLWLEPGDKVEDAGAVCLTAAFLCASVWAASMTRATRALALSRRFLKKCQGGHVERRGPLVALAGVVAPRLILSGDVVRALSSEEMAAVLRHEEAHRIARDNAKRLALLLAPSLAPFWKGFGLLEREWARLSEWAADDLSVGGDPQRAVALAAALVRVARLGPAPKLSPVTTSLIADGHELAARVDRLVTREVPAQPIGIRARGGFALGLLALAGCALAVAQPATLGWAHRMLEELIR